MSSFPYIKQALKNAEDKRRNCNSRKMNDRKIQEILDKSKKRIQVTITKKKSFAWEMKRKEQQCQHMVHTQRKENTERRKEFRKWSKLNGRDSKRRIIIDDENSHDNLEMTSPMEIVEEESDDDDEVMLIPSTPTTRNVVTNPLEAN